MPAPSVSGPMPRPPRVCTTLALALALLGTPRLVRAEDKAAPAKAGTTTSGNSVTEGFRSLGQQISDPKTLDRIKGHEQDFEKNVKESRDQQRKSHPGELRASDATDMANDPKMGGQGKTKGATRSAPQPKSVKTDSAAPPAAKAPPKAPPPAAAPAR